MSTCIGHVECALSTMQDVSKVNNWNVGISLCYDLVNNVFLDKKVDIKFSDNYAFLE
jgi:hypothetical protein